MIKAKGFVRTFQDVIAYFRDLDDFKEEVLKTVKQNLHSKYDIPHGTVSSLLRRNINQILETEDIRLPQVFIKEVLDTLQDSETIEQLFTPSELKELEQFHYQEEDDTVEFPLEIFPALRLNEVTHSIKMSAAMIAKLAENQILNYNYDIQREARTEKRKDSIIKKPNINPKNIREMRDLILKGQLKDSTIYINAAPRTSDSGDELVMDEKNHKLTITEGTRLDILDGFHRCLASQQAYAINPDISFNFNVVVSNYTTKEAQLWQAQHAKAMPWSGHRIKELQQENRSDKVVTSLKAHPEIDEAIGSSARLSKGQLVNFTTLSTAIDKYFKLDNRRDEVNIAEYLSEYLLDLIDYEIDWNIPRESNPLTSAIGVTGVVYYLSKFNEEELTSDKFYKFLDKYKDTGKDLKGVIQANSLNLVKISADKSKQLEKFIERVSANVQ